jgi:hypothetical protein
MIDLFNSLFEKVHIEFESLKIHHPQAPPLPLVLLLIHTCPPV